MNSEQGYSNSHNDITAKKRGNYKRKISFTTIKEFEIETELLNKIVSIQRAENKQNILNGRPEITIKVLLNKYLRAGIETK